MSVEEIKCKLDNIFFTRLGYEEGVVPFHEGGWKDVGATATMIITFCQDIKVNCYVHHREDMMAYIAPNVDSDTAKRDREKPIVNISIWGDHVYFYGNTTAKSRPWRNE